MYVQVRNTAKQRNNEAGALFKVKGEKLQS